MNYSDNTNVFITSSDRTAAAVSEAWTFEHVLNSVNASQSVEYALRPKVKYSSAQNSAFPGYASPVGTEYEHATSATLNKAVWGVECQLKITGDGTIVAAPGFEAVIAEVSSGASGTVPLFYVPNMGGVSNIGNLAVRAWQNDSGYPILTNGRVLGAYAAEVLAESSIETHELVPPAHYGDYITGVYYGPYGYSSFSTTLLFANAVYHIPFYVRSRTSFNRIGVVVTTAGVGECSLGLSKTRQGQASDLVAQATGTCDLSTVGEQELTIATGDLEAGMYSIHLLANAAAVSNGVQLRSCVIANIGEYSGSKTSDPATGGTLPYGVATFPTIPATQTIADRHSVSNNVPFIYLSTV